MEAQRRSVQKIATVVRFLMKLNSKTHSPPHPMSLSTDLINISMHWRRVDHHRGIAHKIKNIQTHYNLMTNLLDLSFGNQTVSYFMQLSRDFDGMSIILCTI